ncbi:MAG: hypothetical protein WBV61_06390 [Rhodanobacteraceae bacterium]
MKIGFALAGVALLVGCGVAWAGNTGTLRLHGHNVAVTAIYAHTEPSGPAGSDLIVFSDRARASSRVEKKVRGSFATIDGGVSADTVFRELSDRGAHPVELVISPASADGTRIVQLSIIEARGGRVTNLDGSKVTLHLDRLDDRRIEGNASYRDKKVRMELHFALDKNQIGRKTAALTGDAAPPPPPPPLEPTNPRGMLMAAVDLLEANAEEYYRGHNHSWPSSVEQVLDPNLPAPRSIQSRTIGSEGVISVVFKPDVPRVGGKMVSFTPTPDPDPASDGGFIWQCSTPGMTGDDICP